MIKCEVPSLLEIMDKIVPVKGTRDSKKDLLCFVPDCERKHITFGMCSKHSRQLKIARPADFEAVKGIARSFVSCCSEANCKKKPLARGLCRTHYRQVPEVKAKMALSQRKSKTDKGIKVMSDFSSPFITDNHNSFPANGFVTLSYDANRFIIKTNLRHLTYVLGYGQNLMMTRLALNNLAEDQVVQFMLDEGTYSLGIIVPRSMEIKDLLDLGSKHESIMETPTRWKHEKAAK